MARRIVINGRFLTQPVTGVQRYGREVLSALAGILKQESSSFSSRYQFEILMPSVTGPVANLNPIPVRSIGRWGGQAWEQFELPRYAAGYPIINFANTAPIRYRNQIVTIHDASVFAAPDGYSQSFRLWYRALHRQLAKRVPLVVTDSAFSRDELGKYCGLDSRKCLIVPLGAEHILREPADLSILERLGLGSKQFVLCAGSLNPNKNLSALVETAHRLQKLDCSLVVAGGGNARVFQNSSISFPDNVKYTGYVSDAQLRALYESASCFVFPSKYEGFGLPPLEAMACGCPVVSSNAASLPEVGGSAAMYVDPNQPEGIAEAVIRVVQDKSHQAELSAKGKAHAAKIRWETTARQWLGAIDSACLPK